jgi:hypothetical protein
MEFTTKVGIKRHGEKEVVARLDMKGKREGKFFQSTNDNEHLHEMAFFG